MDADQNTSDTAAGNAWRAPHFPYFWVKGSIMVTYLESLIFLAKNVPPKITIYIFKLSVTSIDYKIDVVPYNEHESQNLLINKDIP